MKPIRILHLITGLNTGGAEIALLRLLEGLDRNIFDSQVVCIIPTGVIGEKIQDLGIPVNSLEMSPGKPTLRGLLRLIELLNNFQPDILQTWLYHADLLGLFAAMFTRTQSVIWNIRSAEMDFSQYNILSGLVMRLCAAFSFLPTAIIVNSQAGKTIHTLLGYHPRKWIMIPNGIDTSQFGTFYKLGSKKRLEWNINSEEVVVGHVARIDPQKDHDTLLRAAAKVNIQNPKVHFVCIGEGPVHYWDEKKKLALQLGLTNLLWVGRQTDMPSIYNAFDMLVSSSKGEAFPNVVAEAMACGIPCIVTDTGDSELLVGETGITVQRSNPDALANAIISLAGNSKSYRNEMGIKARQRIIDNFNLTKMIQGYSDLYQNIIKSKKHYEESR